MAVEPGSERWKELVAQGILHDSNRNWFLGDAALEIAPMGEKHGPVPGLYDDEGTNKRLRRYADEVGLEFHTLREYRQTAAAWQLDRRLSNTSWSVHQELKSPDRQHLIKPRMTVTEARTAIGLSTPSRATSKSSAEDRAAAAERYLADPKVAEKVAEKVSPGTASKIIRSLLSNPETARAHAKDRWKEEPRYRTLREAEKKILRDGPPEDGEEEPPPPPKPEKISNIEDLADKAIDLLFGLYRDETRLGQLLVVLEDNRESLSKRYIQRLNEALQGSAARAQDWADKLMGIAGMQIKESQDR